MFRDYQATGLLWTTRNLRVWNFQNNTLETGCTGSRFSYYSYPQKRDPSFKIQSELDVSISLDKNMVSKVTQFFRPLTLFLMGHLSGGLHFPLRSGTGWLICKMLPSGECWLVTPWNSLNRSRPFRSVLAYTWRLHALNRLNFFIPLEHGMMESQTGRL